MKLESSLKEAKNLELCQHLDGADAAAATREEQIRQTAPANVASLRDSAAETTAAGKTIILRIAMESMKFDSQLESGKFLTFDTTRVMQFVCEF